MKKTEIKVFIADDHDIIRQGLKRIISFEEDIRIVGEAVNGEQVINKLKVYKPDVLLLDMNMPLMDGLEVLQSVKKKMSSIRIVMLTVENDRKVIRDAINIGADGYILKDSAGEEITDAIRMVYRGDKYIDKFLVSLLFNDFKNNNEEKESILDVLTRREIQVLLYISKGLSNREIGKQLYLSEKTVKNYASNLFRKLNANDRVKAAVIAVENDIEDYYKSKIVDNQ